MKGLYLCAREHRLPGFNIDYNDIEFYPGLKFLCDMRELIKNNSLISGYDFFICTPPCNYYSRANYRRESSKVAQKTKDLLPLCIDFCLRLGKPFIIENVCNSTLLPYTNKCYIFDFGNHTFYTNIFMLVPDKSFAVKQNKQYVSRCKRDNNYNVDLIIKLFLESINA